MHAAWTSLNVSEHFLSFYCAGLVAEDAPLFMNRSFSAGITTCHADNIQNSFEFACALHTPSVSLIYTAVFHNLKWSIFMLPLLSSVWFFFYVSSQNGWLLILRHSSVGFDMPYWFERPEPDTNWCVSPTPELAHTFYQHRWLHLSQTLSIWRYVSTYTNTLLERTWTSFRRF